MIRDTSDASDCNSRPGVGLAVLITSNEHPDCVVLGKRKGKVGDGLYQLPGGHLEFSESWEDAAYRETLEETGLHITNVKFCHVVNTVVPSINYHYVTIFMKGEVSNSGPSEPENMEPNKCDGWKWIKWDDMPDEELLFYPLGKFKSLKINPLKI